MFVTIISLCADFGDCLIRYLICPMVFVSSLALQDREMFTGMSAGVGRWDTVLCGGERG